MLGRLAKLSGLSRQCLSQVFLGLFDQESILGRQKQQSVIWIAPVNMHRLGICLSCILPLQWHCSQVFYTGL